MITVFEYLDYRCFLKDKIYFLRKNNSNFSYRNFNRQAGIRSSSFLKLIIDGKRNLGLEGIRKIAKGLKLNQQESDYFENLVLFNQAKDPQSKNKYFNNFVQIKKFQKIKSLTIAQYQLFSHWYYVAIIEALRIDSNQIKDAKWLQKRLYPKVKLWEIRRAIKDLVRLKLIEPSKSGNLIRKNEHISSDEEVEPLTTLNYHLQMSQLAGESLKTFLPEQREFSALSICVSQKGFDRAKKEIQQFRKKLHQILEEDSTYSKNQVCQINLQIFPLTKLGEKNETN